MLADVLESPTGPEPDPGSETPRPPGQKFAPSRRRVTSPDANHPFDPLRADSPHSAETYTTSAIRLGSSSPRSPLLVLDTRKTRSPLRFSRLRPGSGKEEMYGESTYDTAHRTRPASARGSTNGDRVTQRVTTARRPGSAGEIARMGGMAREGDLDFKRPASSSVNGKARGMRVRASSELTRPSVSLSTIIGETDEHAPCARLNGDPPRCADLRPPLPVGAPTLAPVPVSPGLQSTYSGESALADDSDVDADAPTTPSLTTGASRTGSRSNSSAKDAPDPDSRSRALSSTPKPLVPMPDSETLDRTRAREDADRRRKAETARELEEKKRRSKYFKLKGPSKEKCHAFSADEVPYPSSYSPNVLNNHNLELDLGLYTISSVTFHKFDAPPAKVLDLGCGTGYWVLRAAREWTETEFVGFDLVPIQPSLERIYGRSGVSGSGASHMDLRLQERIRWVHGNFLEKLPFKDGEFDLVRCRKIARGVPESKWDGLYEEIVRVMKPGAAFEHIEEDIVFPTEISNKPNPPAVAVYPTPSPSRTLPTPPYLSSVSLPPTVRPPDQYRRSPSTSFSSVIESPVEGRNHVPSVSSASSASLVDPMGPRFSVSPIPNHRATLVVPGPGIPIQQDTPRDSRGSGDSSERAPRPVQSTDYAFYDPRVHTRLEELFVAMHDARWINLKPLSLIPRLIQEHMTGMVSSPPVNMCLPPRPRDAIIQPRVVSSIDVARASGEQLAKRLAEGRLAQTGMAIDEKLFEPQPGDEEIARHLCFDLSRAGAVTKNGLPQLTPIGQFHIDLSHLPLHLSTATSEVLACKEAIWEHLKEQEPSSDRREYDALIRRYQTDMQDRIGLSAALRQQLHWGPPESDFMRTPDQRVFEEHYARAVARDRADPATANRPPGLMRSIRAFVAWKAAE